MRTKKYVLAVAIFGGMLFTAQAAESIIDLNEQTTSKIERSKIVVPSHG
ncbi:hypothetical protein [Bizionia argentinensis]|nr:hypothetical protein [Bizionia argentinensis]